MDTDIGATAGRKYERFIRGSVGEKVLAKSPELFNQRLPTILSEVLQNARRAGSTRVDIALTGDEGNALLTVKDDGRGIEDMAKLVTFGSSGWDHDLDVAENAAGMGVFSLASRGATIRSLGKSVVLTKAVFCGQEDAEVHEDPSSANGTELSFPVREQNIKTLIEHACRFYPLPVTLNGQEINQSKFLSEAVHVVEWEGLRIGVFTDDYPLVTDLFSSCRTSESYFFINFHGHVVACEDKIEIEEVTGQKWRACVEVISAPDLGLVLPTRSEPIANKFLAKLKDRSHRALLEAVALGTSHSLAYKDAKRAEHFGITLPPASICLRKWHISTDEYEATCIGGDFVTVGDINGQETVLCNLGSTCGDANLSNLIDGWEDSHAIIVFTNDKYAGYPDYDKLRVIHSVEARATDGDTLIDIVNVSDTVDIFETDGAEDVLVDALTVRVLVKDNARSKRPPVILHEQPANFFFTSVNEDDDLPVMTAVRGTDPGQLIDAIVLAFFCCNSDRDSDSYDTQLDYYRENVDAKVLPLLLAPVDATNAQIMTELEKIKWLLCGMGDVRIHIQGNKETRNCSVIIKHKGGKRVKYTLTS